MNRRELLSGLAAAALASGCTSQAPSRAQTSPARYGTPVPLPSPTATGTISLEKAIGERRSLRAFRPDYAVTPEQVMHYLPNGHRAQSRAVSDLRPKLKAAAVGQSSVGTAPVVIVVAAVPGRLSHRYGNKAEPFVQIEVGHAAQNILLQAAALGLAAVPVGSLDSARAADALALPPDQTVLYLIPVGRLP